MLTTVLVTMIVSVLISVGLSSKEITRRLGEYHDDIAGEQRDRIETLEKEVSRMQIKQKEVYNYHSTIRVGLILVEGRGPGDQPEGKGGHKVFTSKYQH